MSNQENIPYVKSESKEDVYVKELESVGVPVNPENLDCLKKLMETPQIAGEQKEIIDALKNKDNDRLKSLMQEKKITKIVHSEGASV